MDVDQELDEPRSASRQSFSEPVPPHSMACSEMGDFSQVFFEMQASNPTRSPLRAALGKQLSAVFDSALGSVCGHGASSSSSSSSSSAANNSKSPGTEGVQVFLRLRPLPEGEVSAIEVKADGCSVRATAPAPLNERKEFKEPRDYSFTSVMDERTTQEDVYSAAAEDIVEKFQAEGKSGLIFTYGVTNAGKSHTVLGTNEDPGLLPRAFDQIVAKLDAAKGVSMPAAQVKFCGNFFRISTARAFHA